MSRAAAVVRTTHARLGAAAILRQSTGPIVADGARQLIELERRGAISRVENQTAFDQIVQALRSEVGAWKSPKERRKVGAALERASQRQLAVIDRALLLAEAEHALGRRSASELTAIQAGAARDRTAILAMLRGFSRGDD